MSYLLMRRHDKVVSFDLDMGKARAGKPAVKILEYIDSEKLPISVKYSDDKSLALFQFLQDRIIPDNRIGYKELMEKLCIIDVIKASKYQHFLSLSDQYWITEDITNIEDWDEINFFNNEYSYYMGNTAFGFEDDDTSEHGYGPDLATNGRLIKTWRQTKKTSDSFGEDEEDIECVNRLVKLGSAKFYQEPYNEVMASEIAKRIISAPVVTYKLKIIGNRPASICNSYLNEHTMGVTAYDICKVLPRTDGEHIYAHLHKCCKKLGIEDYEDDFESMLAFDYLIGNVDRHLRNFEFLYDTETDEWLGLAPIFDNGSSLWYNETNAEIATSVGTEFDPKVLKYVKNLSKRIKMDKLMDLKNIIYDSEVYSKYNTQRALLLNMALNNRVEQVSREFEQEIIKREQKKEIEKKKERTFGYSEVID